MDTRADPGLAGRISPKQFHEADGVEDWRVLGEGACAYFRTGSLAAGARLVQAIAWNVVGGMRDPDRRRPRGQDPDAPE